MANINPINNATPLAESNKGYQLLLKMGWGKKGLGTDEQGMTAPVTLPYVRNKWTQNEGLGIRETPQAGENKMISNIMQLAGLNTYGTEFSKPETQGAYAYSGYSYTQDQSLPDIFQKEDTSKSKPSRQEEPWHTKWMREDFHEMMAEVECVVAFSYEMLQNQMTQGHVRSLMPECPKRIILRTHDSVLKMDPTLCVICNEPGSAEHFACTSHEQAYLMKQMRFGLKAFKQIYGIVPITNIQTNGGSNLAVEVGHFPHLPDDIPGIKMRVYKVMVLYSGEYLKRKCLLCDIQLDKEPYLWVHHILSLDHAKVFIKRIREMDPEKFVEKYKYVPAPWPWMVNHANQAMLQEAQNYMPQLPRPVTPEFMKPSPRLCILRLRSDFRGYGFNLKGRSDGISCGHYIAKVAPGSPADCAAMKDDDRIIEVGGSKVKNLTHIQVVNLIKANRKTVRVLVVDSVTDAYYEERKIEITGTMPGVQVNISKLPTIPAAQTTVAQPEAREESPPPPPPPPPRHTLQSRKPSTREESPPPPPPPPRPQKQIVPQAREESPPPPPPPPPKRTEQRVSKPKQHSDPMTGGIPSKRRKEELPAGTSSASSMQPSSEIEDPAPMDTAESAEQVAEAAANKKRLVQQIQNLTGLTDGEHIVQDALLILEKAGLDVLYYLSRLDPDKLKSQVQKKLESGDDKLLLILQKVMQFGRS